MARFFLRDHHETNSFLQLAGAAAGSEPERFVEVELQRLDDYVPAHGWSDVHVLEINAEGYDLEILKGWHQLLSSGGIPMLFT